MNVQLTYRGCRYQSQLISLPPVRREVRLAGQYRGTTISLPQYEFQTLQPVHLSWRTMRFLGKVYLAAPSLALEAV